MVWAGGGSEGTTDVIEVEAGIVPLTISPSGRGLGMYAVLPVSWFRASW